MSGTMDPMATEVDQQELAQQFLAQAKEQGIELVGPDGLLNRLTKNVLETALEAEMDEHLGYGKHDVSGRGSGNSRNGTRTKTCTWDRSSLSECWREAAVQRCLVHVQRNVRTYLTGRPRTDAGKALLRLGRALTRITSADEAAAWLGGLNDWHQAYGQLVKARTYRNGSAIVPAWVRAGPSCWYTHDRLRNAYRLLERLSQGGTLFTYLRTEFAGLEIASTTNRIEGGTNAQLRLLLRAHPGMSEEHRKRAIEWYLYLHSESPLPPARLIRTEHHTPTRPTDQPVIDQPHGPTEYGNAATAEEGLWARAGWGRTPLTRPALTRVFVLCPSLEPNCETGHDFAPAGFLLGQTA